MGSAASFSSDVSRGCSSASTSFVSRLPAGTVTGTISSASRPSACALAARCCDRYAKASCAARSTPNSAATFSAVSGIESMPHPLRISGLTSRQPIVVSYTSAVRANGVAAFGMTNGARLMLSTPPATTRSASPATIARAAEASASRPEPQSRLTVLPGTSSGRPPSSAAIRATLRLSSPAWLAQPRITSSVRAQSTEGWRATSSRTTCAARSSGRTPASAPAYRPIGVRTPATR